MLKELKPHNKKVYIKLKEELSLYHKAVIVQATGTGKGVIANNIVFDLFKDKTILFVVPSNAIKDGHIANLGLNGKVIFTTFQKLCLNLKTYQDTFEFCKKIDVAIFDEMHRGGASEWAIAVGNIINIMVKTNKYCIGLTATPQRYSDNKNIVDLFFDSRCIKGVDLIEAIKMGILPTFKYIVSLYGLESEIQSIESRLANVKNKNHPLYKELEKPVKTLQLLKREDDTIRDTISKEISHLSRNQKWIVFCEDIESISKLRKKISYWFHRDINFYEVHSNIENSRNKEVISEFNGLTQGCNILLSVNMLNEGVHIKNITGIIMLRKTLSPIVYLQQIGRALSVDINKNSPIIFDFIGNYRNLNLVDTDKTDKTYFNLMRDMALAVNSYFTSVGDSAKKGEIINYEFTPTIQDGQSNIIEKVDKKKYAFCDLNNNANNKSLYEKKENCPRIIIKNYVEEIDTVLRNIKHLVARINNNGYTAEEDAIIFQYYPEEGKEILPRFSNRKIQSIYTRAYELGVCSARYWSDLELDILKKYYDKEDIIYIMGLLHPRSRDAIENKARELGLESKRTKNKYNFDNLDLKAFEKDYRKEGKECFERYGMSYNVGRGVARKYHFITDSPEWTSEEDARLKHLYEDTELGYDVCTMFEGKTEQAVKSRISKKKYKSGKRKLNLWTLEEEQLLIKYWGHVSKEEIEKLFPNKKYNTIKQKALRLKNSNF